MTGVNISFIIADDATNKIWKETIPDTILQLIVIGWKDFPGDSAKLVACPWGTILQLAVIGWKAVLP